MVKTSEARNKIRAWFKKEKREENIAAGREELEKEFRRSSISLTEQQEEEFLAYLAEKQQMKNVDDFLAAIGYGGISLAKIAPRIKTDYVKMFRTSEAEKAARPAQAGAEEVQGVQRRHCRGAGQLSGKVRPVLQPAARR